MWVRVPVVAVVGRTAPSTFGSLVAGSWHLESGGQLRRSSSLSVLALMRLCCISREAQCEAGPVSQVGVKGCI
jgi:hypothetical protein